MKYMIAMLLLAFFILALYFAFHVLEKNGKKFFPIFHPSYLLRYHSMEENSPRYLFKQDLLNILKEI